MIFLLETIPRRSNKIMSESNRFLVYDNYPYIDCGSVGSVYKAIEFDEKRNSSFLYYEFQCRNCNLHYEAICQEELLMEEPYIFLES